MVINIHSTGRYPADALSNFAPHAFSFDGHTDIPCMEAFLQSLKFEDPQEQQRVLAMPAREAKQAGSSRQWHRFLYWNGRKIDRFSADYARLIESAYRCLLQNPAFRQALADSKGRLLLHTIGKAFRRNTVLTWWEFVGMLHKLRKEV